MFKRDDGTAGTLKKVITARAEKSHRVSNVSQVC